MKSQASCLANPSHDEYRSGSGLRSHASSSEVAAPSRYGGIDASTLALRSRHSHAVSVKTSVRPAHDVDQSAGHPSHGCGPEIRGGGMLGAPGSTTTP